MIAYAILILFAFVAALFLVLLVRKLFSLRLANAKVVSLSSGSRQHRIAHQLGYARGSSRSTPAPKRSGKGLKKPWGW